MIPGMIRSCLNSICRCPEQTMLDHVTDYQPRPRARFLRSPHQSNFSRLPWTVDEIAVG